MRPLLSAAVLALLISGPWASAEENKPAQPTPEQRLAQLKAIQPSVVVVEYTLKYDNGEPPRGIGFQPGQPYGGGEDIVAQERPVEVYSYLIADDLVVSEELPTHERFVKSIEVRFGDDLVPAKPVAWAVSKHAVFLKLDRPLKGAKPLLFDPSLPGPYTGLVAGPAADGAAGISVTDFSPSPVISPELGTYLTMPHEAVVVDKDGKVVGMSMSPYLKMDESWKAEPTKWEQITVDQRQALLDKTKQAADGGIVRVTLNFRSPKQADALAARMRGNPQDGEEVTEQHLPGIVLEDGHVIVPASLKPGVTARLERIRVYGADGEAANATFVGSLKDYGAFIAKLDQAPAGGAKLSDQPIFAFHNRLIPHAQVEVRGEERQLHLGHSRIESYARGWRRQVYPDVHDDQGDTYLFHADGTLVAFPIQRREKIAGEGYGLEQPPLLTPAHYLRDVLANLQDNLDSTNIPLGEADENRVAWLGVVLQPLDQELARANSVAEQTQDGSTGALVNFIYPGSPAANAGVEPGWVLVRLYVEGFPQPVDVTVDERAAGFAAPWDRWDELPEQVFDRIPQPWPNAVNSLSQTLTDIGFGTAFSAEFYNNGEKVVKEFKIEQSTPHYNSSARHKADNLGLTVREITYEVRQYFQLADDEPGVIVSKIEPGSRASIAGVKPYEMVTHVNGQPVSTTAEFAAATAEGDELRLTIKRMTRTRQVPIKLDAPPVKPAAEGAAEGQ